MRQVICIAAFAGLVSCGGGGGGSDGFDANAERAAAVDFLERRSPSGAKSEILTADNLPSRKVVLSGPFGARIGHTETALLGRAQLTADFQASQITGKVDELGIHEVRGVSLYTSEATNKRALGGALDVSGTIIKTQPDVPGATFDALYQGRVTGWPDKGAAQVVASTHGGAFTLSGGLVQGTGQVEGSAALETGGSVNLTGGYVFVKE